MYLSPFTPFYPKMEQSVPSNLVGPTIRRLREAHEWTQETLAARCNLSGCDITRGTLAKIEAEIRGVNDRELITIASALGVSIGDLFPQALLDRLKLNKWARRPHK
jgi:transcriptional regulator with XRE-family HTH domain